MSDEIGAAWIAAGAAIRAARIQGEWTLAAGGAALLGGIFALWGAVIAARRQVRLEERRDEARVSAYRFQIETILAALDRASMVHLGEAKFRIRNLLTHRVDAMFLYPPADELSESHWEDHALLGVEVVRAVYDLRGLLREYNDFRNDVSAGRLYGNDVAPRYSRPKGDIEINTGRSADFPQTNIAETNEIFASEIRRSVESFGAALKWDKPADGIQ
jgi:hypothetical protein